MLGRPVAESGHSGVQEEEAAIRQWRCMRGEAEASPVSKLSARTCGFICQREAAGEAAQDGQSGFQEVAAPSAAKKGENRGSQPSGVPRSCRPGEPQVPGLGSRWADHGGMKAEVLTRPSEAIGGVFRSCAIFLFPCRLLFREKG